jgi:seryl-tRNA synthetase
MSSIKQCETAEPDRPAEAEIEANIRELLRQDRTNLRQVREDSDVVANHLSSLLRRVSASSTGETDKLIGELQTLRDRLRALECDIMEYVTLGESVRQLTKIVADSVTQAKEVPDAASVSE